MDTPEELARRLAAAYISWHMDTSYETAYRNYVSTRTLGNFWHDLAENVRAQAETFLDADFGAH